MFEFSIFLTGNSMFLSEKAWAGNGELSCFHHTCCYGDLTSLASLSALVSQRRLS